MVTLFRVYDDPDLDGELAYEPEDDDDVEAENAHTLSIRRASGEEVLTVFSPNEEWSVYLRGASRTRSWEPRATRSCGSIQRDGRWSATRTAPTSSTSTSSFVA